MKKQGSDSLCIYVADDHHFVRELLINVLKSFARVGHADGAADGSSLIELIEQRQPDLVILDLDMPVMTGSEAALTILARYPGVKLLVLTMYDDPRSIVNMVKLGVQGYLVKNSRFEEIEKAIYTICDGGQYFSEMVCTVLKNVTLDLTSVNSKLSRLSEKELRILSMLVNSVSVKEIAVVVGIQEKTVYVHKRNIMKKLDVSDSIGLLQCAIEHGLIYLRKGLSGTD